MLEHAALCFFHVLMVVVTIAALMPWYLVVLPPMLAFFYSTMQYYRASMRELARFYSTTKSPIFAIFGEIVDGRASLRAYGLQPAFFGRWCRRFNLHARFARAMFAASVWQVRAPAWGGGGGRDTPPNPHAPSSGAAPPPSARGHLSVLRRRRHRRSRARRYRQVPGRAHHQL